MIQKPESWSNDECLHFIKACLFDITRAIAPVLLPVIDTLRALDIEEGMDGEILSAA